MQRQAERQRRRDELPLLYEARVAASEAMYTPTRMSVRGSRRSVVGVVNSTDGRAQLDAAVTQLDTATEEQGARARATRGEVSRRRQAEVRLKRKYLTPLSSFARAQLRGVPDFAALTPSGGQLRTERLVQSAWALAAAAAPYAAQLTAAKFPADFLAQLRQAAEEVRTSLDARADQRVRRTGATKELAAVLKQGRTAVATLDALVSHLILGNERLEREWRSAKRVPQGNARSGVRFDTSAVAGTIRPAGEPKSVATAALPAITAPVAQEWWPRKWRRQM